MSKEDEVVIKKMANLLRAGARMLQEVCPICKTPLVRLKSGEVICPKCERRVYIVKSDAEERNILARLTIQSLEDTLTKKISFLNEKISRESDLDELYESLKVLIAILEAMEKIRRLSKD